MPIVVGLLWASLSPFVVVHVIAKAQVVGPEIACSIGAHGLCSFSYLDPILTLELSAILDPC